MLNCAYRWLRTSEVESEFTPNSPEFKIASAVMGMAHIYNSNADKLTPDEQANLRISYNVEGYAKTM